MNPRPRRAFGVPTGTSMLMAPVPSRSQVCASAMTSARCAAVRPPRALPTKTTIERSGFL